jgi:hypothetical protein
MGISQSISENANIDFPYTLSDNNIGPLKKKIIKNIDLKIKPIKRKYKTDKHNNTIRRSHNIYQP